MNERFVVSMDGDEGAQSVSQAGERPGALQE